ncbi:MAG: hypothetical protein AB7O97_04240 [Planctomycetota bacterium]
MHPFAYACSVVAIAATVAVAQQTVVVPAAFASTDAASYVWVPGASDDVREQTLVGSTHLAAQVGRPLTALELRRNDVPEAFAGAIANLTVILSTSPRTPLSMSTAFADNVGADASQVFAGTVAIPASPVPAGPVDWTAANTIRIAFQQPFLYQGGTLCIDVTGTTVTGQTSPWWMADAAFEVLDGAVVDLGPGCGPYANAQGQWSFVAPRSLAVGGHARLWAYGPPGSFAIAVLGDAAPAPVPLAPLGIGGAGCFAYLGAIRATALFAFAPQQDPALQGRGGLAEWTLPIPNQTWALGASVATQWLELSQLHASNGVRWTIASSVPTLDMALLDGVPGFPIGNLTVDQAHVLRLEYQ